MDCYNSFVTDIVTPIYDLNRGTNRFKYGRILNRTQWLSNKEIELIQKKNLRSLLNHAYETVPYYNKVFKQKGILPSDIKKVSDLTKLPVLTKALIRENYKDLISRNYPVKKLIPYRSGGSGDQVRFFITKDQLSWEVAAEYRAYEWSGYRPGDNCFMFWGSPIDISKYKSLQKRVALKIERIFIVDTYIISNTVLERFVNLLISKKPKIIKGYASSVYLIAKFMVENRIRCVTPNAVITTAETLFPSMRTTIEKAFNCPVFDYYGSREIGAIAAECEQHNGYHISAENVAIEFVRNNEHVSYGEKGLILATSLRNYGMPFIRYKIGDVGEPSNELCSCGRGLPLMKSIEGRISDFMAVYDEKSGQIVPVGPIYPLIIYALMQVPLQSVQVIQESLKLITIKAVKGKGFSQKHADFLINYMHSSLGNNIEIVLNFVDSLPPSPSGKRSTFISKINPFDPYS